MKTVIALALFLTASTGFAEDKPVHQASKPNIIIVMPDDSGYGNHSCFGNPVIKTPNIDVLAKQSLLLTRYHSSARCSPSRAKLLSGRHEFLGGVTHTIQGRERLSLDTITLPQALKTAGYATGMFGKWHNGKEGPYRPENRGFDECWMYEKGARMKATISHNGKPQRMDGTYPTDLFFKKATEWIDVQRQAKKPFFVYLPPKSPHGPFKEDPSDMPNEDYKKFLGTHPEMTVQIAKIFWEVENIDMRVGEMIKQLETWGIADNTLFIFIGSDNGASGTSKFYNAGMKGQKGHPYQGGTRVPAFFRWPGGGIEGGSENAALISQMDIMPTLLEITGTPMTDQLKQQVEGRSLVSMLKNPATDWEDDRHLVHHVGAWLPGQAAQSKHARVAIQNKRFTLVNNKNGEELFDLKNDPGETNNVINEYPEVVDQLRTVYDQWWIRVQPRLVNEDAYEIPPAK
jgi:arylsulfatase